MTALDHTTTYAGAAPSRTDVASRVANGLKAVLRAMLNRRHLGSLNELSDHQLADIGLMRSDLFEAKLASMSADPTATLSALSQRRAEERMARRVC
ncbi:DUF1127 domain-containing protein [Aliihoeflea aestuarii]|uniref:DUF1127 domain-containing protein n=1 Tax=Aliihoeflea aestuarii TaxID=453840 RepID=UPI0020937796|nr:DUF1127 domain-containing protein [Aliihoeflea aestuarii]MCO6389729.1 DUF1127 domain-containing protein [Aliihoeflea aestuarii]